MAIFNLDSVNESYDDEEILSNMLEAVEYMNDLLGEGARTDYVERKFQQHKDQLNKAESMPDKITKQTSKEYKLPFGRKLSTTMSHETKNKEKEDLKKKSYDSYNTAAKYTGGYEDYSNLKNKPKTDDGKDIVASYRYTDPHGAGKPQGRFDKGAHGYFSTTQDHEAIVRSKKGKEQFNKDFGGPETVRGSLDYRINNKWQGHPEYNKKIMKTRIKETCLNILSNLDDM